MHALVAPVLLIMSLGVLAWFQRNDLRAFRRFREIEDTARRQRTFLRWARNACAMYLGMPLVGLALLGRIEALWTFPAEFAPLLAYAPVFPVGDRVFLGTMFASVLGGIALGVTLLYLRGRRPAGARRVLDISPMLPRNRAEALHLLPVILNAGVSEEICFRLYLPLLLALCGAPAWAAFLAATLIFAWLHRYQGWLGILLTGAVGTVLAALYFAAMGLALPIAVHLVINFNALIVRPALQRRFGRSAD
ncbi:MULTISPECIES: CPBP family intramembrane glutamic endopeptidase [unclassified Sphingomonas]|jgi:uncharacterized protein|nr:MULTISPECIES: CPBP family intramembrane glutamic endopeptidase [unclassified Sphingomonas]